MKDQADKLEDARHRRRRASTARSPSASRTRRCEAIAARQAEFVFATPERLADPAFLRDAASRTAIDLFVDRRGALHLAVGPRLPARVPRARRGAARARQAAGARADRHGDAPRWSRTSRASSGGRACAVINTGVYRPNLHFEVRAGHQRGGEERSALLEAVRARPARGIVYTATVKAAEAVHALAARRGRGRRCSTTAGSRRASARDAGRFMAGDAPRHGRDQRLRHGHRQAGHPLRHPLPAARQPGGVLPGGRPRRPRRRAARAARCSTTTATAACSSTSPARSRSTAARSSAILL